MKMTEVMSVLIESLPEGYFTHDQGLLSPLTSRGESLLVSYN